MTEDRLPVWFNRTMLYVSDLKRSVSFYTMLGLQVSTEDDEVVRLVDDGGTTLVLHVREQESERPSRGCRLYFATPDADTVLERLTLAHPEATVLQPVQMMSWGRRHGYMLDPDGWELSIYEPEQAAS